VPAPNAGGGSEDVVVGRAVVVVAGPAVVVAAAVVVVAIGAVVVDAGPVLVVTGAVVVEPGVVEVVVLEVAPSPSSPQKETRRKRSRAPTPANTHQTQAGVVG
jgi:hypothetical protein